MKPFWASLSHGCLLLLAIKPLLLAFKQLSDIIWLGQIKVKKIRRNLSLANNHWNIGTDFPWVSFEKS